MTVIDSLVVRLGLDSKNFERGSKTAEDSFKKTKNSAAKTGKDIEQAGKQGAEFFNQLRKSALQFFSVLTVGRGLSDFTRNVIGTGAQLDRMSTRIGESASDLSRWQGAVRQSGGTAEGFLATVQGLSQQFTQLKETGTAPMSMLLNRLGVSAGDASGKAKPVLQLIRDIGDELERSPMANGDKFNLLQGAGFDEGTINLLMRGKVERDKLLSAQKEYSSADAKAAREAQENWEKTKLEIERTTQELVIKMLPALKQIAKSMADIAKVAVPMLESVLTGFNALNDSTNGWLLTLGFALVSLRAMSSLLGVIGLGGAAAAGTGGAAAAGGGILSKIFSKGFGVGAGAALYSGGLNTNEDAELARRRKMGATIDKAGGAPAPKEKAAGTIPYDTANKFAAAEKAAGLPPGLMASIMKQETGNRKEFQDDPAKYHYEKDANGKRKSSAFGPFGILESTAKNPGYGVPPLKDKTMEEQTRFASQYAAARIRAAGSLRGGLAGYGEGDKYASSVMSRLPGETMSGVSSAGAGRGSVNPPSVSIGEVKVYTQATDAAGIARDMRAAIVRQADTGMR